AHVFDALTVNAFGGVNCETTAFAEPTEATVDSFLASLVGASAFSLDDGTETGPGCRIAQMLPRPYLLPATRQKVVFTFSRVNAFDGAGLSLAGTWELLDRTPAVWIEGPSPWWWRRDSRSSVTSTRARPIFATRSRSAGRPRTEPHPA